MLVVTRMEGGEVVIGDPAKPVAVVRVCEIRGNKVRLGVVADRSVPVHRAEVAAEMRRLEVERGAET